MTEDKHIKAGEYLLREGEESTEIYYLSSGKLGVYKVKGSLEKKIGDVNEGELVGEMSFFDKEPRSATIKAESDCVLKVIPSEKLEIYLKKQPEWFRNLLETLIDRIRRASSRIRLDI